MRRHVFSLLGVVVVGAVLLTTADAGAVEITPPTPHAGFDYQIGGGYAPPEGVEVVSRDHTDEPAAGVYSICYVNAFQTQPGAVDEWGDLVLRDANGEIVYDDEWAGEAMLDIRAPDKRDRIAAKVSAWIDDCADRGFHAVEPDNYDSFTRVPDDLLDADQAQELIRLLAAHAHTRGLAIAQKNTLELAERHSANGLDFAVVEQCGEYDECGEYAAAFGDYVIDIEYTADGLAAACAGWGDRLSIVLRDEMVVPPGDGYVREIC